MASVASVADRAAWSAPLAARAVCSTASSRMVSSTGLQHAESEPVHHRLVPLIAARIADRQPHGFAQHHVTSCVPLGRTMAVENEDGHEAINALVLHRSHSVVLFDSAQACTCMAPAGPAEALESISRLHWESYKIYQSLWDAAGVTRTGNHRVKFEVTKRWNSPGQEALWSLPDLPGKPAGFRSRKKEYLVYVAPGSSNIETGICTGTKSIVGAEPEIEQLDRLVRSSEVKP